MNVTNLVLGILDVQALVLARNQGSLRAFVARDRSSGCGLEQVIEAARFVLAAGLDLAGERVGMLRLARCANRRDAVARLRR